MSDPTTVAPTPPTVPPPPAGAEPILTQQGIIALSMLAIGALTVLGVFLKGDAATVNTIAGLIVGSTVGSVSGFYFGSSKGSQSKDAALLPGAKG